MRRLPQQKIRAHAEEVGQTAQHLRVRLAAARLPFAHGLLGDVKLPGKGALAQFFITAQFAQHLGEQRAHLLVVIRLVYN